MPVLWIVIVAALLLVAPATGSGGAVLAAGPDRWAGADGPGVRADALAPLRCMDSVLARFAVPPIALTTLGLAGKDAAILSRSREMIVGAVARMSATSRAVRFVDIQPAGDAAGRGLFSIRGSLGGGVAQRIDLSVAEVSSREILPHTAVSLVNGGDGRMIGLDPPFDVMLATDPTRETMRGLIEVATLVSVGRLARVPYWRCLGVRDDHPAAVAEARALDISLLTPAALTQPEAPTARQVLALSGNDVPRAGETVRVSLESRTGGAAHCYYEDADRQVVRIFPNRFQPDPWLPAGEARQIPGPDAGFEIVAERAGSRERIICLSAPGAVLEQIPSALGGEDLTPLAVQSLDQVVGLFQLLAGERLAITTLPIRVR